MEKHEKLPIIKTSDSSFFKFDNDKSNEKIKGLINKHIIFNLIDGKGFVTLVGKLLSCDGDKLTIRMHDDGTKQTKESWTDYDGTDLFKDWEEKVSIDNIEAIEEYIVSGVNFSDNYKNKVCDITNKYNDTIRVLLLDYDGLEIEFEWKENTNNNIIRSSFPLCFIKNIRVVEL